MAAVAPASLAGAGPAPGAAQLLAQGLEAWKKLALDSKRDEMDQTGEKIVQNQDLSQKSRKDLAAATKEFKSAQGDEPGGQVTALLRKYQAEIDSLTVRARFAEKSFLALYKDLADAPDPAPLLGKAVSELERLDGLHVLQQENDKLRAELEDYSKEIRELKNQEVSLRLLERQVRSYEDEMASLVDARVAEARAALDAEHEAKSRGVREREARLAAQTEALELRYRELHQNHTALSSSLLAASERLGSQRAARDLEQDSLVDELARAHARIAALEAAAGPARPPGARTAEAALASETLAAMAVLERDLAARADECAALNDALRVRDAELTRLRAAHLDEVERLRAAAAAHERELAALREADGGAALRAALAGLQSEVAILRGVEFGDAEAGDAAAGADALAGASLEALLAAKNRRLQSALAACAHERDDASAQLQAATASLSQARALLDERAALIARLEDDLMRTVAGDAATWSAGTGAGAGVGVGAESTAAGDAIASALLPRAVVDGIGGGGGGGEATRLAIVSGQRDRLRARVGELEDENRALHERVHAGQVEVASLKKDNVALYEKIRYLEAYDDIASERDRRAAGGRDPEASRGDRAAGASAVESRYRALYEEQLNPFTVFSRKQATAQYAELNAAERVTLTTSRILLGSKFARTFLFFYSLLLHVLVFAVLYKLSASSECAVVARQVVGGLHKATGRPPADLVSAAAGIERR